MSIRASPDLFVRIYRNLNFFLYDAVPPVLHVLVFLLSFPLCKYNFKFMYPLV